MSVGTEPPSEETAPYAVIDASDRQLIRVRAVGPLTDEGYRRHLDEFWQVLEQREGRFALILHQGRLRSFPTRYVRMTAAWVSAAQETFAGRWVAAAYVITNPVLRGAVTVLFWTARSPIPVACFATEEEAEFWARSRLREAAP